MAPWARFGAAVIRAPAKPNKGADSGQPRRHPFQTGGRGEIEQKLHLRWPSFVEPQIPVTAETRSRGWNLTERSGDAKCAVVAAAMPSTP